MGDNFKGFVRKILGWVYVMTYFRHIYFPNKISSTNANVLVLSHRNGAIDAFVYAYAFKKGVYLVAKQLQRNPFLKFIFPGISVYRKKDKKEPSCSNRTAIMECLNVLKEGKEPFCIFPEGTSSLGPKHLPFFDGYAKMAYSNTKSGYKTTILPVAIIYDDPTCLGGSVWVVPGQEIKLSKKTDLESIQKQTLENFEQVTLSYTSPKDQLISHQTAIIASLSKKADYYAILKKTEQRNKLVSLVQSYNKKVSSNAFKYKQTVIYPQSFLGSLWVFLITLPIVLPTLVFNILSILVAYFFGQTRKNDPNTITLWRTLTGYPVALLFYLILLFIYPKFTIFMALFSIWGFHLYGAFKKHLYALLNFVFYHKGYSYFKETQNEIISKV